VLEGLKGYSPYEGGLGDHQTTPKPGKKYQGIKTLPVQSPHNSNPTVDAVPRVNGGGRHSTFFKQDMAGGKRRRRRKPAHILGQARAYTSLTIPMDIEKRQGGKFFD